MKKRTLLLPMVALTLLLTACGQQSDHKEAASSSSSTSSKVESNKDSSSSSSSNSQKSSSSDQSSSQNSSDQSSNGSSSNSASGITQVKNGNQIEYEKAGQSLASYKVKDFGSDSAAQNGIQYYQDASENKGLPTVDLGYGIKGAKDAGAGQLYINFPMGNWSVTVRGLNSNQQPAINSAKELVSQLQSKTLPVPNSRGAVMLDNNANTISVQWQEGSTLHTLSGNNTANVLDVANYIHQSK